MPYCQKFTAPGLSPSFGCDGTNLPRTHSLVPVAEYYPALVTTPVPVQIHAQRPPNTPLIIPRSIISGIQPLMLLRLP